MRLSKKQKAIMRTVLSLTEVKENGEIYYPDINDIVSEVAYEVSKPAMVFSLRFLIRKGLLEKKSLIVRKQQHRRPYAPTDIAFRMHF